MYGRRHYQAGRVGGRRLRAALLASTALVAAGAPAAAQDATWIGAGNPANFTSAGNWSSGSAPTGTAFFDVAVGTNIQNNSITSMGGWTFNPGASAYQVHNNFDLSFTGAGIVVNGGSVTLDNYLASTTFQNSSSAGSATILNTVSSVIFQDTSTAGSAAITNTTGTLEFQGASTAGNAAITNNDSFFFRGSSTAGNATLTNNQNFISFNGNSTAGNATIVNNAPAVVNFTNTTGLAGDNRISAGSIAGAGVYVLGANELTVGANNSSTEVSGEISGAGSLVKTGTGTLTLTGGNSYSGGTTVNNGTVQLGDAGNTTVLLGPAATGAGGTLNFVNVDTSGMTTITNGGAVNFYNSTSAAGAVIGNTGTLKFRDNSTAATATITNDGTLEFSSGSTAQSAHITNNNTASFVGNSTAAGSAITNNGSLSFRDNSTGGSSAITNTSSGTVDFSNSTGAAGDGKITAGSIAGAGNYILGANQLTVGGNNTATEVSGAIFGTGSLEKVGYDTLTLSGVNTYSGGTTITNGALNLGSATGLGTIQGAVTVNYPGNLGFVNSNTDSITGITNSGNVVFFAGTAGHVTISNSGFGVVYFNGSATAGNAVITSGSQSGTIFQGTSSAGSATITGNAGFTQFRGSSTAGDATITADSNGTLRFYDSSTAGNAAVTINGAAAFYDTSSAGTATITNNNGVYFRNTSTAGSATINNNGALVFSDTSTAGNAAITNTAIGVVGFSSTGPAGDNKVSAGSIAGGGAYYLQQNELTVGGNNLSTTVSGIIDGVGGSLVKTGTGTMTLSGVNTYTGGTTLAGGTVSVGSNANLGAVAGALTFSGGTLQVTGTSFHSTARTINWGAGGGGFDIADAANSFTVGQSLGGTGGLNKLGAGTLVLSGANTFSGGTTLAGGTVSVGSDANLGDAAGALTFNGGSLRVTGTSFISTARTINWGAGGGGFDIADAANSFTVGQSLGGTGGLSKSGAGALVLTGTNSYGGGTTVNDGTLELGNSGTTGALAGTVSVSAGATFNLVNADTSGMTGITNGGIVNYKNGNSAGSTIIGNSGTLSFLSTSTAGTSAITTNAGGTTVFTANSTADSATLTTNSGGVTRFTGGSSGGSARLIANSGGMFDFSGLTSAGTTAGSFEGAGRFNLGSRTLTVGGNNLSTSVSGVIADGGASGGTGGALVKTGFGTLTLTGFNTYTGGTTINFGTLQLGDSGQTGKILNVVTVGSSASFEVVNADTSGITTITNSGTTNFRNGSSAGSAAIGNNSNAAFNFYNASTAGNATISNSSTSSLNFRDGSTAGSSTVTTSGFVNFYNGSSAGSVTITGSNAGGIFFSDTSTAGYATVTNGGTGGLTFAGSSTAGNAVITNSANMAFSGTSTAGTATIINSGTAQFFAPGSGGSARLIASAGGVFDFSNLTSAGTTAGSFEGAGTFYLGSKALTVGGNDLSTIVSGVIDGTGGSLLKTGTGTLMLSGVNTYSGATTVNAGTLSVNGSILSSSGVTVNAGGTLGGTGHVGNTTVMSGGNLAAGNSIGTLTVNGSLTFNAGATYTVEVSPSASDRTNVVGGTATLNGATVQALPLAGSFRSQTYTILNASGGFAGTQFAGLNVTGRFSPARNPHLTYDLNNVYLVLDPGEIILPSGTSRNQANVAAGINSVVLGGAIPPTGFDILLNLDGAPLKTALTQISGETAAGVQQGTFNAMTMFMGQLTDPFSAGRNEAAAGDSASSFAADDADAAQRTGAAREAFAAIAPASRSFEQRWSVWSGGYGGTQTTDGNTVTGTGTATSRVYGGIGGADYRISQDMLVGFALAGGGTSFSVAHGGSGRSDMFQAGAFARYNSGAFYLAGALAYGWQDVTTDRTVAVAGIDRLQARFNASTFAGRVEGGYRFATPWMGLTPYGAGQVTSIVLPAYAESVLSGANTFALSYGAKTVTASRSELGLRTDRSWAVNDAILTLRGRAAWAHDFSPDRAIAATFQTLPGASFTVNGAAQAKDAALTTASAELKWRNGFSLGATFEGEFSHVARSYAGKGVVRYAW